MHTPTSSPGTSLEYFWFFDTLVCIRTGCESGGHGISLVEHRGRFGDSPPLHIHHTEDEIFYVLEGEMRFVLDGKEDRAGPGTAVNTPRSIPHTYRIESPGGARWLTVTHTGDFERFIRRVGRMPDALDLPPPGTPPAEAQMAEIARIAREHHIEICGPPLGPVAAAV